MGDPCPTPIKAYITTVPRILCDTWYNDAMALRITMLHPRRFMIFNKEYLGTRLYALEKSTYTTYNLLMKYMNNVIPNFVGQCCVVPRNERRYDVVPDSGRHKSEVHVIV